MRSNIKKGLFEENENSSLHSNASQKSVKQDLPSPDPKVMFYVNQI